MNTATPNHGTRRNYEWRPSMLLPDPDDHTDTPIPTAIVVNEPPKPTPPPVSYSQADLDRERERVRQEEKDKLYAEQTAQRERQAQFEAQVAELTAKNERDVAEAAAKAAAEAKAEAEKQWDEMSSKDAVEKVRSEFKTEIEQLNAQRDAERATFAKEREFQQLAEYTRTKVAKAVADNEIAPELQDLVTGNNPAEVDASLEQIKVKTSMLVESFRDQVQAVQQVPARPVGVSPTGYAPTGPLDGPPGQRQLTIQEIKDMPISEYAKYRKDLLGAAGSNTQDRGMYV